MKTFKICLDLDELRCLYSMLGIAQQREAKTNYEAIYIGVLHSIAIAIGKKIIEQKKTYRLKFKQFEYNAIAEAFNQIDVLDFSTNTPEELLFYAKYISLMYKIKPLQPTLEE